jgi:MraZ protein
MIPYDFSCGFEGTTAFSSKADPPSTKKPWATTFSRPMFIGEYKHTLDDKGRIAIPSKFRKALSKGAVVTRGLDTSLFLFPKEEWDKLAEKLANLPLGQSNSRAFARLMLAGAMDVELDKQGRAVLPEYLREYAGMKKNIILAGLFNRLELWDEVKWESYKKKVEGDADSVAEKLGELGF